METPLSMHATSTADLPRSGLLLRLWRSLSRRLTLHRPGWHRVGSWERLASQQAAQCIEQARIASLSFTAEADHPTSR